MVGKLDAEEKWFVGILVLVATVGAAAHIFYEVTPFKLKLRGFVPSVPMVGQEINAIVEVTNYLDVSRTYRLEARFDDKPLKREIFVPAKRWKLVYFTFIPDEPGKHTIRVENHLMEVQVDPYEEPQENAEIELSFFYYGPLKPRIGEEINTRVVVKNLSEFPGEREVKVKVGGEEMSREVLVRGKQVLEVVFTTVKKTEGKCEIEVENCLMGPETVYVTLSELLDSIRELIARVPEG